jgi:predicted DNA-binding helix-hairpin-helix protein
MDLQCTLVIRAGAAKYNASCASSGTELRDSRDGNDPG